MQKICATEIILLSLCVIVIGWSVSINGGRKEDIRKRVVPGSLRSSVRFADVV